MEYDIDANHSRVLDTVQGEEGEGDTRPVLQGASYLQILSGNAHVLLSV